jgi:predicted Rossmann fold flavoprotein
MGLSLRNTALQVVDNLDGHVLYKDFGELLFTHFGVSGPMALSASAHLRPFAPERYTLELDLKPALDFDNLDARLTRLLTENPNKSVWNVCDALLPKSMVPVLCARAGIAPKCKANQATKAQRAAIIAQLKRFTLTVTNFRPIDEAIVTSGGVDVREVVPTTMESKLLPGLFFAGEVLDVDAYTGGYNLQIAFSTGRLAGLSATRRGE